ncbi:OmpA family protein [Flavobacterium ponti]|uniref:OmpA family protein n=1 Tax=Flavobacterium ponti TaxID=665133 RepID=A0ABV9P453_9FLAO
MKKIYILSLLFCFSAVFSQSKLKLKNADKLYKELAFVDAAKAYDEYLEEEKKPSVETLKRAGNSYYNISDNRNALKWYQKLYDIQGDGMSDDYFLRYIQALKGVMDYEKADELIKQYLKNKGDKKEIERYMWQKNYNDSLSKTKPLYTIKNLDVNTENSDFGTTFYGDKIVFTSSRDAAKLTTNLYAWNNQPFLNLYVGDRNMNNGDIYEPVLFLKDVMTKYHEATATFTPDLKTVYYTTNIVKKNKLTLDDSRTNNFQIIKGEIVDGQLTNSEGVFFNSKDYSVGHPSLSETGRWLFFASDMPGGYGETDLYVVKIAEDGTMSSPQNLGPKINTIGNELFPYFRDGILYFSSDGHYGWGDLDVYQSTFLDNMDFTTPQNLGQPINSNKDDFAYIFDPNTSNGYFSSNRAMGKGDDDIYYFTKAEPECNQMVSGKVTDKKSKNNLSGVTISVYDSFDDLFSTTNTNAEGKYIIELPCDKKMKIVASKENYSKDEKEVTTLKVDGDEIKDIDFEIGKYEDLVVKKNGQEQIDINPIFFNYDKYDITPQAAIELDKVVFVMEKFPNVKIKIESHTDSRGNDAYNMTLSDNRAKSTQAYIISKGIDPLRIQSAIGYGESRLINKCSNGVKCSEEEHFKNRRSEFIVIEK